jgi:NADH-quinone oxidoreductase subunit E
MSSSLQAVKDSVTVPAAGQAALLQMLLAVQDASPENYVSEEAVNEIAHLLDISRSRVYSTASFYSAISLKPRGQHIIRVCINAPCENAGKQAVLAALEQELGVSLGGTTADGRFTLEGVSCLGACYMSPAIKIDKQLYGDLTAETAVAVIRRYREGEAIGHTA